MCSGPPDSLSWDSQDPNQLICCPYDPTHRFQRKKLQYHLLKEHPNHQPKSYVTCPLNASHRFSTNEELEFHMIHCDSRGTVEAALLSMSNPQRVKGDTSVPVPSWKPPSPVSESWDAEDRKTVHDLNDQAESFDGGSQVSLSSKRSPDPPPVVRMPIDHTIADTRSPRKALGRGRGRAFLASALKVSKPGIARTSEPESQRGKQSASPVAGLRHPSSVGVRIPDRGLPASHPSHIGLGRGLNTLLQRNPVTVQSPAQRTERVLASKRPPQSSNESDAASFASPDSDEDEYRALKKKIRKLEKMLRQIEIIEEKEHLAQPLQDEQIAKLRRKGDVEASLADAREELNKLKL